MDHDDGLREQVEWAAVDVWVEGYGLEIDAGVWTVGDRVPTLREMFVQQLLASGAGAEWIEQGSPQHRVEQYAGAVATGSFSAMPLSVREEVVCTQASLEPLQPLPEWLRHDDAAVEVEAMRSVDRAYAGPLTRHLNRRFRVPGIQSRLRVLVVVDCEENVGEAEEHRESGDNADDGPGVS